MVFGFANRMNALLANEFCEKLDQEESFFSMK